MIYSIYKIIIKNKIIDHIPVKKFKLPETRYAEYKKRLEIFLEFIKTCNIDFNITFNICLSDTIPQTGKHMLDNLVGYSCEYIDKNYYILIPNLYLQYRLNNIIEKCKSIQFENKKNRALFIGNGVSFTRTKFLNEFMQGNIKSLDLITYRNGKEKKEKFMSKQEQLNYKYLIDIDGVGTAFDRPIWILNSNSVLFIYEDNKKIDNWKHFLIEDKHYVKFNLKNIDDKITYYNKNPELCLNIIRNSNLFVKENFSYEKLRKDTYKSLQNLIII